MKFGEHVFLYCERGTNEALLAEPINAASNGAFLLAALAGLRLVMWRPREERSPDQFLLPVLVLFIGLGSLAFHLYADRGRRLPMSCRSACSCWSISALPLIASSACRPASRCCW